MKVTLAIVAAFALAGCASTPPQTLVKTEAVVVMPDKMLFTCQNVRRFPNPDTLTDVDVAKLIVKLHKNNTECQKNINSIYKVLDNAKKTAEESNEEKE